MLGHLSAGASQSPRRPPFQAHDFEAYQEMLCAQAATRGESQSGERYEAINKFLQGAWRARCGPFVCMLWSLCMVPASFPTNLFRLAIQGCFAPAAALPPAHARCCPLGALLRPLCRNRGLH